MFQWKWLSYFEFLYSSLFLIRWCLPLLGLTDRFTWSVSEDSYTNDHFSIILVYLSWSTVYGPLRYYMDRADWDMFHHLSNEFPVIDPTTVDPDQHCENLTSFLKSLVEKSILLSLPHPRKSPVPWWSKELSTLVRTKHMLGRRCLTQKYNNFPPLLNEEIVLS